MSNTIVAKMITDSGNSSFFIQKNEQNSLKGLIWGTVGGSLTGIALGLTAVTAASIAGTALASMGILTNDSLRNSVASLSIPAMVTLTGTATLATVFAVKFTGFCYSNAIHHLGPEYQIIRRETRV